MQLGVVGQSEFFAAFFLSSRLYLKHKTKQSILKAPITDVLPSGILSPANTPKMMKPANPIHFPIFIWLSFSRCADSIQSRAFNPKPRFIG
jgi:hypothetical protein